MDKLKFECEIIEVINKRNIENEDLKFVACIKDRRDKLKGFIVTKTASELYNKICRYENKGYKKYGQILLMFIRDGSYGRC